MNKKEMQYEIDQLIKENGVDNVLAHLKEDVDRDKKTLQSTKDKLLKANRLARESTRANNRLEKIIEGLISIKKPRSSKKRILPKTKEPHTPILMWSDWHVEGAVIAENVNFVNEYNPQIAKERVEKLVDDTIEHLDNLWNQYEFKTTVLWLGGDFIEGWIHEELTQTNAMSPIEATNYALNLLDYAISRITKAGYKLDVICNYGNHGRITTKMQHGNQEKTNYEQIIYAQLSKKYTQHKFFTTNEIGYYKTEFNNTIRYSHGHQLKGLSPASAKRFIDNSNSICQADISLIGHFHTLSRPHKSLQVNGSLKGVDEYCFANAFGFERPSQAILVFNEKLKVITQTIEVVL